MNESAWMPVSIDHLALLVRVGEVLYALPVRAVEEVLPNLPLEPVPACPPFVKGVVFVRGHLIPILDARERLRMPESSRNPDPHLVCLRIDARLVGVEVDEAVGLIEIDPERVVDAAEVGARPGFFAGLFERGGRVIRLLDPERLMAADELPLLAPVGTSSAHVRAGKGHDECA